MPNVLQSTEDIQIILHLSKCLSATNICGQNMLLTCDFIFIQHNSYSDRIKSLNLKTCKSITYRLSIFIWTVFKNDELLDLFTSLHYK